MWDKKDCIFSIDDYRFDWAKSHASFPTPLLLRDRIRVYYSTRCPFGSALKSVISYFDTDRKDPQKIIYVHEKPILMPGALGTFDDCGVQPNCAIQEDNKIYLYYLGWNPGVTVLARNNTGLAISEDRGMHFKRAFEGPILDRNRDEPYFAYTPCILIENDQWHAWYGSGTAWVEVNGKAEGLFEIKYAHSKNGIDWKRPNITCIKPQHQMEVNCRPSVIKYNDTYHMWYSYRCADDFRDGGKNGYLIGYATSKNFTDWTRKDDSPMALKTSETGWDSDMVCFGSVINDNGVLHHFYNGNGFGETGIGYAVSKISC